MRSIPFVALTAALLVGSGLTASAQDGWSTVKGQVLYPAAKPVPPTYRPRLYLPRR